MHTFVLWNNIHCSLLSITSSSYWLLCQRWCSRLRGRRTIVQFWCMGEFPQGNPSSLKKKKKDRQSGWGVQMWEVGFWLHWQLWGTRSLSEQEMTWPSLWEANPAWHQPPPLGASRVTLSTHKGQRSDSGPAGGRENKNMLCCLPFDRIKRKGDFLFVEKKNHKVRLNQIQLNQLGFIVYAISTQSWKSSGSPCHSKTHTKKQ